MALDQKEVTVPSVSKSDVDWLHKRIDYTNEDIRAIKSKIRLLVRILVDKKIIGEELAKTFEESKAVNPEIIKWYESKWIQGAIEHKGALRKQLGVKEDETIPKSILQQIVNTETGKTVAFKGKSITVTAQLKRRALLALKLGKMNK